MDTTSFYFETNNISGRKYTETRGSKDINDIDDKTSDKNILIESNNNSKMTVKEELKWKL